MEVKDKFVFQSSESKKKQGQDLKQALAKIKELEQNMKEPSVLIDRIDTQELILTEDFEIGSEDLLDQIIDEIRCYEDVSRENHPEILRLTRVAFGQSIKYEEVNGILDSVKELLEV